MTIRSQVDLNRVIVYSTNNHRLVEKQLGLMIALVIIRQTMTLITRD